MSHQAEEILYVLSGKVEYTLPFQIVMELGMVKIHLGGVVHAKRVIGNEPLMAIEAESPPPELGPNKETRTRVWADGIQD